MRVGGLQTLPLVRQQLIDAGVGVRLHAQQHVGQVRPGVDAIGFAGGHQGVEASRVLAQPRAVLGY